MDDPYKKQVALLLDVLPEVAKETCFALHGGTAINLFVRDMPRLSVDIDLTYVVIEERAASLHNIHQALVNIKQRIETLKPGIKILHKEKSGKLQIALRGVQIKIEVNMVGRGLIDQPEKSVLCATAQEQFDAFCAMTLVPPTQLFGGKICAALDRQHPRDLFDVKLLFDNEGFNDEIKRGVIFSLVSSNRPTHELLSPRLQDQRLAFTHQFDGMSAVPFNYDDYEQTRNTLICTLNQSLTSADKAFLLSVNRGEPDWTIHDFSYFPSVQWKLLNINTFKTDSPDMHQIHYKKLSEQIDKEN